MRIIVVGAGTVGYSLAEHLSRQGHLVSVVDWDERLCEELSGRLDVLVVNARATNPQALEQAGIRSADMVVAVTPDDDTNLVVCALAEQYGVTKRIARIAASEYTDPGSPVSLSKIGVTHVIEPEKEIVRNVLKYVELPGVTEAANFHFDTVYLRGYRITDDMPIASRRLSEINELHDSGTILIVMIVRNGVAIIPSGSEMILPDDEIVAIMTRESLPSFRKLVNQPPDKLRKIVVSGDSLTSVKLSEQLRAYADRVILVDPDEAHARLAAAELSGVEILHGDCTRVDMLQEVHVENASFFIASGKDAEDNIMSCLLAKAEGAREVIAVGSARRHIELFLSLGLDRIITPHDITLQTIIANVIKVPIGALLTLKDAEIEVTRYVVEKKSRALGRSIRELMPAQTESFIIGSVFRGDEVIIPTGDTVLQEGDEVLVLSHAQANGGIRRVFSGGMRFRF